MFTHHRFRVLRSLFQGRDIVRAALIPERYRYIPQITAPLGAVERAIFELTIELFRGQFQFADQAGMRDVLVLNESGVALRSSEAVPRTNHLADIAAKDPIFDQRPQLRRNILLQLNGQIRDTASCINGPVRQDAFGWTGFDAARTCPTLVCE